MEHKSRMASTRAFALKLTRLSKRARTPLAQRSPKRRLKVSNDSLLRAAMKPCGLEVGQNSSSSSYAGASSLQKQRSTGYSSSLYNNG